MPLSGGHSPSRGAPNAVTERKVFLFAILDHAQHVGDWGNCERRSRPARAVEGLRERKSPLLYALENSGLMLLSSINSETRRGNVSIL
jgi:hypothetical protein